MAYRINPAFRRYPTEGAIVGLILSSFGELELTMCQAANAATQAADHAVLKALYRLRSTSSRFDVADCLMAPVYKKHELADIYEIARSNLQYCLSVRNQYAHCNWADDWDEGLFFADLQTSAKNESFDHSYKHVDPPVLQQQYEFFGFTLECLRFADNQLAVKMGTLSGPVWPEPVKYDRPPLHNLASEHIPPWLTKEQKEVHLKRALELEGHGQQRERPPSVLRLTREEWAAKDTKDAREGRSDPEPQK
jgi:hypothetical protein